jgi:hypothetical protein
MLLTAPKSWAADDTITVESLLHRMTDTRWLSEVPAAGERTVQFSSYDRATKLENGKLVNRFANGDVGHYLRIEGEGDHREWILAEAKGPGFVSRIWSANPDGDLRIYVDGSKTPTLAAPFAAITNGEIAPFGSPFGHDASRGRNLYFPFPFAKGIKISTTKGGQYFQVSLTTVSHSKKVESFSPLVLKRASPVIGQTREQLTHAHPQQGGAPTVQASLEIPVGQSADLVPESRAKGQRGAITRLAFKVESSDAEAALARTRLTITFDSANQPQVDVPLGDFFGSGPGINPFESRINHVQSDGQMAANWYMPFRESVRVRLTNLSELPVKIHGTVCLDFNPPQGDLLYFHARWRYQDGLQTKKADGTMDWPVLRVSSAPGRFVGLLLNVFNPTPAWWGEGDEKIYVDGEPFPSTFGTGTEDYFGYAWGDNHTYMNPFHAQTRCDGPGAKGNTSNIRYKILDSIPFQKSLGFDIEVWHWEAVKIQYATLAYFYAGAEAAVEPGPSDLGDRKVNPKPPMKRERGTIEAEDLRVKTKTAGDVPNQDMISFGDAWSAGRQLWWVVHESGARLDLELPVASKGVYAISAAFTKAGDYGIVQVTLDGADLGKPIDLYEPFPRVIHSGDVLLGTASLDRGAHTLSLTLTGKNPKSTNYLVGMDWVKLTPVPVGSFPASRR